MSMPNGKMRQHSTGPYEWWLNGELHRTDGPAVDYPNGFKAWSINDKKHRLDGPAVECENGDKYWYINGKYAGFGDECPPGFYDAVVAYKRTLSSDELTVDDLGDLL